MYPDEFGYWASAARWIGYDWSEVASLGSYYSFGYSLLLTPILKLGVDSITTYRIAIAVNMVLHGSSLFLLWKLLSRIAADMEKISQRKELLLLAVGTAFFYPVWLFYMQMTLTESLLTFLYLVICNLMLLFLEKPKVISAVCLALSFIIIYFVHMRTIGIIIAAIFMLIFYAFKNPVYRKMLLFGAATAILGMFIGAWIKENITNTVYVMADEKVFSVNDYSGQFAKIKAIFSLSGLLQLLQSLVGKLYYLWLATFGLFYFALLYGGRQIVPLFQKKKEKKPYNWFFLFLLLSMLGQFMVTAIYASGGGRLDSYIYGRYNDYLLPVFIGVGILSWCQIEKPVRHLLIMLGISGILFAGTFMTMIHSKAKVMQGYFAAGISYLSDDFHYQVVPELWKGYLFGLLLIGITLGCCFFLRKKPQGKVVVGAMILIEILLANCLNEKYTYLFNRVNEYDLRMYESIDLAYPVYYLYGNRRPYIGLIQFAMQEKPIQVLYEDKLEVETYDWEQESFLMIDITSSNLEWFEEHYEKRVESQKFALFWIE